MTRAAASPTGGTEAARETSPADWVDRHGDALFGYALARVRNRAAAEDLVQETLLAAVKSAAAFRGGSSERTWLVGILRHKLLDYYRALGRERALWDQEAFEEEPSGGPFDERGRWRHPPAPWPSPEAALERREFWKIFDACTDRLPDSLRGPFLLRELEGLDTKALAATLETTPNNVWVMLSRARQRLRRCLEVNWFGKE